MQLPVHQKMKNPQRLDYLAHRIKDFQENQTAAAETATSVSSASLFQHVCHPRLSPTSGVYSSPRPRLGIGHHTLVAGTPHPTTAGRVPVKRDGPCDGIHRWGCCRGLLLLLLLSVSLRQHPKWHRRQIEQIASLAQCQGDRYGRVKQEADL